MKQKVVSKFPLNQHGDTEKSRSWSKAMRIATRIPDVEAIARQGEPKDPTVGIRHSINPVTLTLLLRKRYALAESSHRIWDIGRTISGDALIITLALAD